MCGCFQVIERGFGAQGSEICLRQIEGGQLLGWVSGGIVHFLNDDLNAAHTALHRENNLCRSYHTRWNLTQDLCALTNYFLLVYQ